MARIETGSQKNILSPTSRLIGFPESHGWCKVAMKHGYFVGGCLIEKAGEWQGGG